MPELTVAAPDGLPFVTIERDVEAPRDLVLRCFTDPELLVQWLGPRAYRMRIETYEVRDGGRWRYVNWDDEGHEFAFHGVFHGAPSLDGWVQTFEFEGAPGHVSLDALTLIDSGGRTRIRTHSAFQSVEARDAMVAAGMESGVREGYERMDELLARLTMAAAR
jgi:uncharacterized protein YndB with AHSA1/START domain